MVRRLEHGPAVSGSDVRGEERRWRAKGKDERQETGCPNWCVPQAPIYEIRRIHDTCKEVRDGVWVYTAPVGARVVSR